jgi:hypothetical protein
VVEFEVEGVEVMRTGVGWGVLTRGNERDGEQWDVVHGTNERIERMNVFEWE